MVIDPLVVRIIDTLTGESWVYVFQVGPVRIGRGMDSSLPIARPFVSAQHGCFVFDDRSVRYQDLDPRAGTRVDGALAGGRETNVTDWTRIEMGDLRITTSRRLPDQPVADPGLSPFARSRASDVPAPLTEDSRSIDVPPAPRPAPSWTPAPRPSSRPAAPPRVVSSKRSSRPRPSERPPRRRVKTRFSILAWLAALSAGIAAVAGAGLLLQFRGAPWMPPELVSQIPPWLADWFR
jgi:hypothetical protein